MRVNFTLFLLTSLLIQVPLAWSEISMTFALSPGTKISLENLIGPVKVSVWDQPAMKVEASREGRVNVTIENQEGNFVIRSIFPKCSRYSVPSLVAPGLLIEGHPWAMDFAGRRYYFDSKSKAKPLSVNYKLTVPKDVNLKIEVGIGSVEFDLRGVQPQARIQATVGAGNIEVLTTPEVNLENIKLSARLGKVKYTKESLELQPTGRE